MPLLWGTKPLIRRSLKLITVRRDAIRSPSQRLTATCNPRDDPSRHVNSQDKVTIKNWYSTKGSVHNQIERIEFADCLHW